MRTLHEEPHSVSLKAWRHALQGPGLVAELTGAAFKVLCYLSYVEALALRDNPSKKPHLQPYQRTIAARCGLRRETVSRAINHVLIPLGLIRTSLQWAGASGWFRPLRYHLSKRAAAAIGRPTAPAAAHLARPPRPLVATSDRVMCNAQSRVGTFSLSTLIAERLSTGPPLTA